MEIKIFSPLWGHEHLDIAVFCRKVKEAGFDGLDTWIPEDRQEKKRLFDSLQKETLLLVSHQHQAAGRTFEEFKASFLRYLELSAEGAPLLINSHSGRDYFSVDENLELIDIAWEFSERKGVPVLHETHRGRIGYSPGTTVEYFRARKEMTITADLSHWVCVTESFLEGFAGVVDEAVSRARHVHARVGFEEGPQVPDPRAPEWGYALDKFLGWWDRIVESRRAAGASVLGFTAEFGPPPYLPKIPFENRPVADQWAINCYMKDLLRERYGTDTMSERSRFSF